MRRWAAASKVDIGDREPDLSEVPGRSVGYRLVPVMPVRNRAWTGPVGIDEGIEVEVGERVPVPQIRAKLVKSRRPSWIPVRGQGHHDLEIFRFGEWHWHIDFRFLSEDLIGEMKKREQWGPIANRVIVTDAVKPILPDGQKLRNNRSKRYYALQSAQEPYPYSTGFCLAVIDPDTWQRTTELECLRKELPIDPRYREKLEQGHTHHKLQEKYAGAKWMKTWRCPHRNVSLRGIKPDRNELVHCPLHKLALCTRTGRVAEPERIYPWSSTERRRGEGIRT